MSKIRSKATTANNNAGGERSRRTMTYVPVVLGGTAVRTKGTEPADIANGGTVDLLNSRSQINWYVGGLVDITRPT